MQFNALICNCRNIHYNFVRHKYYPKSLEWRFHDYHLYPVSYNKIAEVQIIALTYNMQLQNVCCLSIGCKGICQRFPKIGGGKYSVYELGFKRCSECGIYIKFGGPRCPCCRLPLRSKKRNYAKISTFRQ